MGSIFKEHKEYSEARNCYNKALLEQPKDYITLYNLGNLERIIGCDELAINQYGIVRSLKEKEGTEMGEIYYNTLINEGICFKNLRLYDQAIGCNDRAIEINSQDETPHFNKSMCLLKKIYGLTTAQPNLNLSFVRNKLCSDAQKSFENVLALNHNNFTAKVALAELVFLRNCTQ
jgi:tetratricopeptide (TPR) repeat protein